MSSSSTGSLAFGIACEDYGRPRFAPPLFVDPIGVAGLGASSVGSFVELHYCATGQSNCQSDGKIPSGGKEQERCLSFASLARDERKMGKQVRATNLQVALRLSLSS